MCSPRPGQMHSCNRTERHAVHVLPLRGALPPVGLSAAAPTCNKGIRHTCLSLCTSLMAPTIGARRAQRVPPNDAHGVAYAIHEAHPPTSPQCPLLAHTSPPSALVLERGGSLLRQRGHWVCDGGRGPLADGEGRKMVRPRVRGRVAETALRSVRVWRHAPHQAQLLPCILACGQIHLMPLRSLRAQFGRPPHHAIEVDGGAMDGGVQSPVLAERRTRRRQRSR